MQTVGYIEQRNTETIPANLTHSSGVYMVLETRHIYNEWNTQKPILGKPDQQALLTVLVCTWVLSHGGCTEWNGTLGKPNQPRSLGMTEDLPLDAAENLYNLRKKNKK